MKSARSGMPTQGKAMSLPAGQFLRLRKGSGCRIVCMAGVMLVTVSGVVEDIDLHASDGYTVPNDGLVLIEAVGAAVLTLAWPPLARLAWRSTIDFKRTPCVLRDAFRRSLERVDSTHGQQGNVTLD